MIELELYKFKGQKLRLDKIFSKKWKIYFSNSHNLKKINIFFLWKEKYILNLKFNLKQFFFLISN